MDILFYHPFFDSNDWLPHIQERLPTAKIHLYQKDSQQQFDYALVWRPKPDMLINQTRLKAIFALGAGVDAILDQLQETPNLFPKGVPLYRLQDTGMAKQMQEYTIAAVMRYFRRLDEYQCLQQNKEWAYLPPYEYQNFSIGVMGLGILGSQVAKQLANLGFQVKGWSRSLKHIKNVTCYDESQLDQFLVDTKLIINLLPSTPQTYGILNRNMFNKLTKGAYLINIARGKHLVEQDLIDALDSGQIKAATLDVFIKEPLTKDHPFWSRSDIMLTPHISAITKPKEATIQVAEKINLIEQGNHILDGLVDIGRGY